MNKKTIQNRQQQCEFVAMLQRCMDKFEEADKLYDEIEDFIKNKMPNETSVYDSEQQDYLHIFEDYDLNDKQLISLGRAISKNRDNRRNWHNIYEISRVWNDHKLKVYNRNTRIFLKENLQKVINNLDLQWKYRSLTEEDISKLLKDTENKTENKPKHKGGRKVILSGETIREVKRLQQLGIGAVETQRRLKDIGLSTIYKIRQGTYRGV